MIVAIDGTTGSGKSGLCKKLANKLGFTYIRSSSFYRALTYKVLQNNINILQDDEIDKLLKNTSIIYNYQNNSVVVIMDNQDVSANLNSIEVSNFVAKVASIPKVREYVRELQVRQSQNKENIIMEGRDIGSVIFPNADIKVFVDCDIDTRAKRRVNQYAKNGIEISFDQAKNDILKRDQEDITREDSPLVRLPEAYYLDTTNLGKEECVEVVINLIKQKQTIKSK